jgi:hypothetical protein
LTVAIKPEQPWPRNWTIVSAVLSYRLPSVAPEPYGFYPSS